MSPEPTAWRVPSSPWFQDQPTDWISKRVRFANSGGRPPQSTRAERLPERYDLSLPENVVNGHPAVTAAIIGPRTMEQLESQLGPVDLQLDAAIHDRIDEIVPPGTNFSGADSGWMPSAVVEPALRRR